LADRDGRIQKGDRVLSINGKSTKGVTHREALSILKVIITYNIKGLVLNDEDGHAFLAFIGSKGGSCVGSVSVSLGDARRR
jgi:hypothetical protein